MSILNNVYVPGAGSTDTSVMFHCSMGLALGTLTRHLYVPASSTVMSIIVSSDELPPSDSLMIHELGKVVPSTLLHSISGVSSVPVTSTEQINVTFSLSWKEPSAPFWKIMLTLNFAEMEQKHIHNNHFIFIFSYTVNNIVYMYTVS